MAVVYVSWNKSVTGFFVILGHFLPCYPQQPKKSKFWKNEKNLEISIYIGVPKIVIICYTIPEILHVTNFYFSFIHFIHFLPFHAQKTKIKKWNNTLGNITILQMCTKNYDHVIYGSYDMVRHGRTDGQKKWYIEMWVPHMKELLGCLYFLVLFLGIYPIKFSACSNLVSKSIQTTTLLYIRFLRWCWPG